MQPTGIEALKILAYLYLQQERTDSARRAALALQALDPGDLWAKAFLIMCEDKAQNFEQVVKLSASLEDFAPSVKLYRTVRMLRARALYKLGNLDGAREALGRGGKEGTS